MILVSDSGASKSEWVGINGKEVAFSTRITGFNPYMQNYEAIRDIINHELLLELGDTPVEEIHFYGAGCSSVANCTLVENAIRFSFPSAAVEVEHDMLGAARALCGRSPGIAAILGTGANSCLYDGERITANVPSLGFIVGDEGSGSHMGKTLLADYLREAMPSDLLEEMKAEYKLNKDQALERVYQREFPARFLASFTTFIKEHEEHEYIDSLIRSSFSLFFEKNICTYPDYEKVPVHFVGGIAFNFEEQLRQTGAKFGMHIDVIAQNPIDGLTEYHRVA